MNDRKELQKRVARAQYTLMRSYAREMKTLDVPNEDRRWVIENHDSEALEKLVNNKNALYGSLAGHHQEAISQTRSFASSVGVLTALGYGATLLSVHLADSNDNPMLWLFPPLFGLISALGTWGVYDTLKANKKSKEMRNFYLTKKEVHYDYKSN